MKQQSKPKRNTMPGAATKPSAKPIASKSAKLPPKIHPAPTTDDSVDGTLVLAPALFIIMYVLSFPFMHNGFGNSNLNSAGGGALTTLLALIMFLCLWRTCHAIFGKIGILIALALSAILFVVFIFVSFILYFGK